MLGEEPLLEANIVYALEFGLFRPSSELGFGVSCWRGSILIFGFMVGIEFTQEGF